MTISPFFSGRRPYCTEYETLYAAMATKPTDFYNRIYDNLIIGLKADSLWSTFDVFYFLAAFSSGGALINWKNPGTFDLTAVSAPTFTQHRGFTYDGVDDAHDTNFRWETAPSPQSSLNNHQMAIWSRTTGQTSAGCFGAKQTSGGTTVAVVNPRNTGDNQATRCNDATSHTVTNTDGVGFYGVSRTASNVKRSFKNNAQVGTDQTTASTTGADESYYIGGVKLTGGSDFAAREIAFACCGSGLSVAQMSSLYTRINTALVAVGAA